MSALKSRLSGDLPYLVAFRHELHRHPEIAYEEVQTSARIQRELDALKVKYQAGLAGGTGIVAYLPATQTSQTTIALRADIDALPIQEQTGKPYASTVPGKMHACGHDGHTTILLGTIRQLIQEEHRPNHLLFLFQPAEENGAGASRMVEDGALLGAGIGTSATCVYGLHGWPSLEVGQLCSRPGPMMASADVFEIRIEGQGTHAAFPHLGVDPILVGSHVVTALQSIVSRNIDPLQSLVVTIGIFEAGSASNVIPMGARLVGTLRALSEANRALGKKRIFELVHHVCASMGATGSVQFEERGYPVTANDPELFAHWRALFPEAMPPLEPVMGGEDFSFYGREVPACFFALGVRPSEELKMPNLHAPTFDFNDAAIPVGVEAFCRIALSEVPKLT